MVGRIDYVFHAHSPAATPAYLESAVSKKARKRPPAAPEPGRHVVVPRAREFIDPELTWFALWCRANRDKAAAEALSRAGIAAYRPLEARRVLGRGGRPTVVERSPK